MKNERGFTLVELAIVLMIIGLLIGGILRGQELMNNARLGAVIKQVTSYTGAINTFRDAYASLPGDIPTPNARLPGCATSGCVNGNGNGIIGAPLVVWQLGDQRIGSENTQFWKHLALTHIISGVDPTASALVFGKSHPTSPVGGGFTVQTSEQDPQDPTGSTFTGSLVLRLHGDLISGDTEENPAVSPRQASFIDRKMDDGKPTTGDVQASALGAAAKFGGDQTDCEGFTGNRGGYNEKLEFNLCVMAFLINR